MKYFPQLNKFRLEILPILTVIVLAAIVFFAYLGNYPLFNPDEGLYAEPAREMLDTGEFITTTLNYAVRFTKPPLVIWAMALCYKLFGVNEFAARIFCATCGFLLTIITYLFTNKYLGRRIAMLAACILLTSPLFIGVGRMAITDMPLSLFIAGGLFSFFHAWQQRRRFWLYPGYVLTAFAVMTKGPVGLLLPALILSSYFILLRQAKAAWKFFNIPIGLLTIALIALPWFVVEIVVTRGAYFQEFIMRENFARFTTIVDAHKGPWWYHIAAVLGGLFPWSILLPQAVITVASNAPTIELNQTKIFKSSKLSLFRWLDNSKPLATNIQLMLFALIWSLITVLFFSLSVSKLLPYTLPAFPALAIIIANQWDLFIKNKQNKSIFVYSALIAFIYIAAVFLCPLLLKHLRNCPSDLSSVLYPYFMAMASFMLLSILVLISKKPLLSQKILFATVTLTTIVFIPKLLSVLANSWERPIAQYARVAGQSHKPLIVYRLRKPSLPFYFGQAILQPTNLAELRQTTRNSQEYYLITSTKYLSEVQLSGFKIIDEKNNFAFFISRK